ncbi:hypothetical protein RchiOBHm_Chr6g0299391 [Rosa chinensis]|uniref:Transmembrane protein n=1 Tax=Rosa chinensis TaxID=74649 RepID=A0A2P6PY78_ROSCH|nr:uncharacterized protein LOC112174743 [Rosa chinensis]PRQ26883.1 hypothetical protein RchiOBHm_Chr6g0299391 [Rosa chinensis]
MAAGNEEWRKTADTHKMSPEEVKGAGVEGSKRPPGHNPGGVLHQRRNLPFSATGMLLGGFLICTTIGYFTLCALKKPEASARDVARVSTNIADPEDTKPRPGDTVPTPGRKGTSSSAVH